MKEHPIEGLMITAMNSIQDMVDVNTIIGEPIETSNNVVIIPISKVSFGFAAGGSEFKGETVNEYSRKEEEEQVQYRLPFGGGSGAGVNINPIAFLVVQSGNVKLLPVNHSSAVDKLLDYMPDAIEKINSLISKQIQSKSDEKAKKHAIKEQVKEQVKEIIKEPEKPSKAEKATTVSRASKPRRGRSKSVDTFEYEYNDTPDTENILINIDDTDDFDD
ncbi:MAG: sporulation protein YtfJ [Clostridia bacterium]|jgi:sporulation protein YtfJ|nr:sporulation protein YtfJ [Clostridia bacterium]